MNAEGDGLFIFVMLSSLIFSACVHSSHEWEDEKIIIMIKI